jgi:hypothetical protein
MNDNSLQITIRNAFYRCTRLMHSKGKEYSPNEDRLENFYESGREDNISPEEALWGMLRKHLTSLGMMCRALTVRPKNVPQAVWEEKLTDAHNYLFLLEALLKERYGWPGPEGNGE